MKICKIVILIILLINYVFGIAVADVQNQDSISKLRNTTVTAYNNKDIKTLMSTWHVDGEIAVIARPEADIVKGFESIQKKYLT